MGCATDCYPTARSVRSTTSVKGPRTMCSRSPNCARARSCVCSSLGAASTILAIPAMLGSRLSSNWTSASRGLITRSSSSWPRLSSSSSSLSPVEPWIASSRSGMASSKAAKRVRLPLQGLLRSLWRGSRRRSAFYKPGPRRSDLWHGADTWAKRDRESVRPADAESRRADVGPTHAQAGHNVVYVCEAFDLGSALRLALAQAISLTTPTRPQRAPSVPTKQGA